MSSARVCRCVLCEPAADRDAWTDEDRPFVETVVRHGWVCTMIRAEDETPAWTFTTGLWHTFGSPELAMFGLLPDDMGSWLNRIGEEVRRGRELNVGERLDGVIDGFAVELRAVDESWFRPLFGWS